MNNTDNWLDELENPAFLDWLKQQLSICDQIYSQHGDFDRWKEAIKGLEQYQTEQFDLSVPAIEIGKKDELNESQRDQIKELLLALHPWRKGPFSIFGNHINSEWRSDTKWQRIEDKISPLKGRRILDVGSGNGYYMLRMLGAGAKGVLGIDPTILFSMQFNAITHLSKTKFNAHLLPVGIEKLPDNLQLFDTVFSMGVFYHRKSPIDHLYKLLSCLRPGGELVLETLVIHAPNNQLLLPDGRYAKMRNVWFIPTAESLKSWVQRCGFKNVQIIDVSPTTVYEQRTTEWMRYESLADFLDPSDSDKTIEGYPAPIRATIRAQKPVRRQLSCPVRRQLS